MALLFAKNRHLGLGTMAARLRLLQSKACQATQFISKHGNSYYKQRIEQNKGYIQDPPTVETCDRLAKQLFYTRLARNGVGIVLGLCWPVWASEWEEAGSEDGSRGGDCGIPGRYESLFKEVDQVKQLWKNRRDLKVEDLGLVTLFGMECFAWFCAGEIIGRGFTITGYKV
ncbi:hypothetical protein Cgig2_019060 [Carnegiea gigantea]|uniref:Uncharacterized protein n=1 Tax=Carnegiea gigantea TaxID=171969 RepID=A0A9Q1QGJ9_9CARY|nr:hypothetical protein Cgig2_019060 [Carnegiea gigantea]